MKKILGIILGSAVVLSVLAAPILTQAVSSTSSIEELIASFQDLIDKLKAQIETLNTQLQVLRQAQTEVKETAKEVKGTLQLINQLWFGMTSEEVKKLQEILATDPDIYPEGLITGYFGRLTENAVKKFQKKICLEQVGIVGPKTLAKINELLTEGAGASGKIPPGLLRAPGILKKLCVTSTTTTTTTIPPTTTTTSTSTTTTIPATTTTTTIPPTTTTTTIPSTTTTTTTTTTSTTTTTTTSTTTTTTEPPTTTTTTTTP